MLTRERAGEIDTKRGRSLFGLSHNLARLALAAAIASCADSTGPIAISPPTNVTVTVVNPGSVRVSWTAPPESNQILNYNVLRDGVKVGESATTFFVDVGLAEGTTYKYAVSANGILGQVSEASAESSAAIVTVPDLTPPRVTATNPAGGTSGMSPATSITVTFSEPVDPASINTSTFVVKDPGGAVVPGTIAYTAASRTAEFKPSPALPNATTVAVTITTGVKDAAGNPLPANFTFSFATRDETPPAVVSTTPPNGSAGVVVTTPISVTFSKAMDAATINATSFTLRETSSATAVAGTVTFDANARIATFQPGAALRNVTGYTATISSLVKDAAGNSLTAAVSWTFTTAAPQDLTPPTIISASPPGGDIAVGVNSVATVTFSEAIDPATINSSTVLLRLTSNGAAVAGSLLYDAATKTATFTPAAALAFSTGYTLNVSTDVRDLAGNALGAAFASSFITVGAPDTTPPIIVSVVPPGGASGVAVTAAVTIAFSEQMDASTLNATTVTLTNTATLGAVTGTVAYNAGANTATFTPSASLAFGASYTVSVSSGVRDTSGNSLAATFTSAFVTTSAPDTAAPTVVSTFPTAGATGVPITAAVALTFSEPMNAGTINSASVSLAATGTGTAVAGGIVYDATTRTATFQPSGPLAYSTGYTLTVTTGAQDVAGNPMAAPFTLTFGTAAPVDATPPTVISVSPPNGAANVGIGTTVSIVFSELMDAATINASTITLRNNASASDVAGTVSYNGVTNTATFTAASGLAYSTSYTVSVSTAAKDVAGNSLATTFTSSFSTQAAPDITPPTIVVNSPANGSANVPVTVAPSVTFSEPMNAGTINGSTISLKVTATGAAIAGIVSYNAATNTATFTPSAALSPGTGYTLTVTTAVSDAAGNSLQSAFTASFTTVPPPDTTAPTIIAGSPPNGASGVVHGTPITVTFSEPMNPATINGNSIFLKEFSNTVAVAGTVSYDSGSNTATFTPSAPLDDGNDFTLNVTTAVSDLAGNKLASNYLATFVTIQHISDPFWQGDMNDDTVAVTPSIHVHLNFTQAEDGHTLTLGSDCRPLPYAYCIFIPLDTAGATAVGPPSPNQNGAALITALTGTFTDPGITFTVTLENGRTFTFSGTVAGGYTMSLVVSGATLPQTNLTLTRSPPFP